MPPWSSLGSPWATLSGLRIQPQGTSVVLSQVPLPNSHLDDPLRGGTYLKHHSRDEVGIIGLLTKSSFGSFMAY